MAPRSRCLTLMMISPPPTSEFMLMEEVFNEIIVTKEYLSTILSILANPISEKNFGFKLRDDVQGFDTDKLAQIKHRTR